MPDITLWTTGLTTMAVGMGIVFLFLIILVFAINIMTKCVGFLNKIFPEVQEMPKKAQTKTNDDAQIALAIALAASQKQV